MNETRQKPTTDEMTGVVLAGGFSRRFGERDKALASVGERSLLERVVVRLGEVADHVVVDCRTAQRETFTDTLSTVAVPVSFVTDPVPDQGPLFGFRTALNHIETKTCVLTACDMPFLDPRVIADLSERLHSSTDADVAAIQLEDRLHPTPAVYRTSPARAACDALLDADETRLSALFDRLNRYTIQAEDVTGNAEWSLFDVDTPSDREYAANLMEDVPKPRREHEESPLR